MIACKLVLGTVLILATSAVGWGQTSETIPRLKKALQQYPEADANGDGVLTMQEARAHLQKLSGGAGSAENQPTSAKKSATDRVRPVFETEIFKATAEELDRAMQAENVRNQKEALQFPKGNGLRIVTTGHSWVGPALRTLPQIALAAGVEDQHIRAHTGGGGTGSANSIWRKEFGKYGDAPARPLLLPAIATGQWDVMTWGAFYGDAPEHYTQWIDVCLASNPKMIFLIQDGWPTFDPEWKEADSKVVLEQLDAAQRDIQQGMFKQLFRELDQGYPEKVHVIPAGAAVVQMIHHYYDGKTPELDCVSEHLGGSHGILKDGGHLSKASGMDWLLGYVYYGMLYHRSPQLIEGFQPPDVSAKFDTLMRDAAWKAVISSPYSGIQDSDRDGVGELVELEAN